MVINKHKLLRGVGKLFLAVVLDIVIFSVIVLLFICSQLNWQFNMDNWNSRFGNPEKSSGHRELMKLYSKLDLGMMRTEVDKAFRDCDGTHLRLNEDHDCMVIYTQPFHFSAKGWILGIRFENDKIVGLRIRIRDTSHYKPITAPPDRIAPGSAPVPSWDVKLDS